MKKDRLKFFLELLEAYSTIKAVNEKDLSPTLKQTGENIENIIALLRQNYPLNAE